jgi:hypothetical protein
VIRLMVAYPTVRIEPTEAGPLMVLRWMVRGAARTPKGWATSRAEVSPAAALPVAWRLVRLGVGATELTELEDVLRSVPGVRVKRMVGVDPDGTEREL